MGRAVISQFLNLSTNSPRFPSSLLKVQIQSGILKKPQQSHPQNLLLLQNRASSRCCCSNAAPSETNDASASSDSPISSVRKRILSGVQPTGSKHLGNYLGAIKNWITLQVNFLFVFSLHNTYETLFFIVDLHAITLPDESKQLSETTRSTTAIYLACGVDTSKATEKEFEIALQIRVMEETKDKKNDVEAYVYDMRNKLNDKYHGFVTEQEKEMLISKLQTVEDWMYEDGTKGVYIAKLEELKKVILSLLSLP
ncbi:hypothetical protein MKW92_030236 [Papaver armeniacum]|nr:hypothetical protein MKW92_030236 [Papaver armeniacum]